MTLKEKITEDMKAAMVSQGIRAACGTPAERQKLASFCSIPAVE
jgi:hypothetical protein